jgi:hypothetical protein
MLALVPHEGHVVAYSNDVPVAAFELHGVGEGEYKCMLLLVGVNRIALR